MAVGALSVCEEGAGSVFDDFFDVFAGPLAGVRNNSTKLGVMSERLNTNGADEYSVMANKKAQTLSRKSAARATGVEGVKNEFVFCNAVHRNTADLI
jgi:hypothetical protein